MSEQWFVKRSDKARGPFTVERLKELADEGKLKPTDEVREGESGEWVEASELAWLFPSEASGEDDPVADEPPTRRKKRPAQSSGSPVEKVKAFYHKNPQKALLLGGGILLAVLLMGMCVCAGVFSLIGDGGKPTTEKTPTAGGNETDKTPTGGNEGEFAKGPNGEEVKVEEKDGGYPPKRKISYYTDKSGNRVLHGISTGYTKDGTKVSEELYVNGRLKRSSSWLSDGRPNSIQEPFDVEWNSETTYSYYRDGSNQKIARGLARYKGEKVTELEGGGQVRSQEWERVPHGETTAWYPNGQLMHVLSYDRGKLVARVLYDQKGKVTLSEGK